MHTLRQDRWILRLEHILRASEPSFANSLHLRPHFSKMGEQMNWLGKEVGKLHFNTAMTPVPLFLMLRDG